MAGYIIEPGATTAGKTDMGAYTWREPTTLALRKQVQQALKDVGRYSGPADGAWGPNTIKGIQNRLRRLGTPARSTARSASTPSVILSITRIRAVTGTLGITLALDAPTACTTTRTECGRTSVSSS